MVAFYLFTQKLKCNFALNQNKKCYGKYDRTQA